MYPLYSIIWNSFLDQKYPIASLIQRFPTLTLIESLETNDLVIIPIVLAFSEYHVSRMIQTSLCRRASVINNIYLRFFHVFKWSDSSFLSIAG